MNFISEYVKKNSAPADLEKELMDLISQYNKIRNSYLIVYASSIGKPIPDNVVNQDDFYIIHDLLRGVSNNNVDMYIETRGGSGESSEEIVEFLHNKFSKVSFIVSGEAKSAGTVIVLSGHEILMTETGSLGPIDAQVRIGRSICSAYDYMEWVNKKREESETQGYLNPFDSTVVAQITPGELEGVFNALEFAKDMVIDWLVKYKFCSWKETESRKIPVTEDMKQERAKKIATDLTNHSKWRSHGRSIKLNDLVSEIGLKVQRIEDDNHLAEIVFRIQNVCRFLFDNTGSYKIFATADDKIFRTAVKPKPLTPPRPEVAIIDLMCDKCKKKRKLYAKLAQNPQIDVDLKAKGYISFPQNAQIMCECGHAIDLSSIRNDIEAEHKCKIIYEGES